MADFSTFGLLWILMNLFFLMAVIAGGVLLTKWLVRSYKRKEQDRLEIHQPET